MSRSDIVKRISTTLQQVVPTADRILYGSEARGEATEQSDIDLLILVDGDRLTLDQEEAITTPLYQIEIETGVAISPIVMLKKEWHSRPIKTPFYINVINEGIAI